MFDLSILIFKENYEQLGKLFLEMKKPSELVDTTNQQEIINLHEAYITELKNQFSGALGKDKLYERPAGFLQEN